MPEFRFHSISGEQVDRISPNYVAIILTISRLGLLPVIFCLFVTELWPLIDVRMLFLLNVFTFYCSISLELGLLLHEKNCSGAIVRFSDNSSSFFTVRYFIAAEF